MYRYFLSFRSVVPGPFRHRSKQNDFRILLNSSRQLVLFLLPHALEVSSPCLFLLTLARHCTISAWRGAVVPPSCTLCHLIQFCVPAWLGVLQSTFLSRTLGEKSFTSLQRHPTLLCFEDFPPAVLRFALYWPSPETYASFFFSVCLTFPFLLSGN